MKQKVEISTSKLVRNIFMFDSKSLDTYILSLLLSYELEVYIDDSIDEVDISNIDDKIIINLPKSLVASDSSYSIDSVMGVISIIFLSFILNHHERLYQFGGDDDLEIMRFKMAMFIYNVLFLTNTTNRLGSYIPKSIVDDVMNLVKILEHRLMDKCIANIAEMHNIDEKVIKERLKNKTLDNVLYNKIRQCFRHEFKETLRLEENIARNIDTSLIDASRFIKMFSKAFDQIASMSISKDLHAKSEMMWNNYYKDIINNSLRRRGQFDVDFIESINNLFEIKTPFDVIIKDITANVINNDVYKAWQKPNLFYYNYHYLPGNKNVPNQYLILVMRDTSSSMTKSDLEKVSSALLGIINHECIKGVVFLEHSYNLHDVYVFDSDYISKDKIKKILSQVKGRGGTSHLIPIMQFISNFDTEYSKTIESELECDSSDTLFPIIVYLTDAESDFDELFNLILNNKIKRKEKFITDNENIKYTPNLVDKVKSIIGSATHVIILPDSKETNTTKKLIKDFGDKLPIYVVPLKT